MWRNPLGWGYGYPASYAYRYPVYSYPVYSYPFAYSYAYPYYGYGNFYRRPYRRGFWW